MTMRNPTAEEIAPIKAQYEKRVELADQIKMLEATAERDIHLLAKECGVPYSSILDADTWTWKKIASVDQQGKPTLAPLFTDE